MIKLISEDYDPVTHERFLTIHADQHAIDRLKSGDIVELKDGMVKFEKLDAE